VGSDREHVDRAVRQAHHHRAPIVFSAQRRRNFREGAIALDLEVVQRKVHRRRLGRDR
jgi:hypothetical protein